MDESEQMPAVRWAFREDHFVFSFHAYVEMHIEPLGVDQVREAGSDGDLLEEYPDRPEGRTKLLVGHAGDTPVHLVVNVQAFEEDPANPSSWSRCTNPGHPSGSTRGRGGTPDES